MLKEIKKVRQIPGEPARRWFNCHEMDLVVWHEAGTLTGFQLCYDKSNHEKALSWKADTGLVHEKVDNGESGDGHYKATPILIKNGLFDLKKVRAAFEKNSELIDEDVKEFVFKNLK